MPSLFSDIIGHETLLRILERAAMHPAPAYLFFGPAGVGKRSVAEEFARELLASHPPDKGDRGGLIASDFRLDAHPDFIRIKREEGAREIVVKQARELLARMHLTAAHGGRKVALIEQADRLNEEAANALLKAVEEPDGAAVYLFLAEQPDRLPATLRSRLVSLSFGRVPIAQIEQWLGTVEHAHLAAEASRGCPGVARDWLAHQEERTRQKAGAERLILTLARAPVGEQCAALERVAQEIESEEDAETLWREYLLELMRACGQIFPEEPSAGVRIGKGLIHAWYLAGSSLSPRLALEWAATKPYLTGERETFSFLHV